MTAPDVLYTSLIAIALASDHFVLILDRFLPWRTLHRVSDYNPARDRLRNWTISIAREWILVAAGVVLWMSEDRRWSVIRLSWPHGWRLIGALTLVLAGLVAYGRALRGIMRASDPELLSLRHDLGAVDIVAMPVPQTGLDLGVFTAGSITAGFCEEFIFRGYLLWVFQPLLGLWGAAILSILLFATAHGRMGWKAVVMTGAAGTILTLIVLIFDSLWPAIALHAIHDITQAFSAWRVCRETPKSDDANAVCDASVAPNTAPPDARNLTPGYMPWASIVVQNPNGKKAVMEFLEEVERGFGDRFESVEVRRPLFRHHVLRALLLPKDSVCVELSRSGAEWVDWRLGVRAGSPYLRDRLPGRAPHPEHADLRAICGEIHAVLTAMSAVTKVFWYTHGFGRDTAAVWTPEELPWSQP